MSISRIYFSALANITSDVFNVTVENRAAIIRFMVPARLVTLSYFNLISLDARNRENASKLIKAIFILSKNTQDGKDKDASTFDDVNANALAGLFLQDSSSQLDLPEVHYNLLQNASKIMVLTRDAPKLAPELLIETFFHDAALS